MEWRPVSRLTVIFAAALRQQLKYTEACSCFSVFSDDRHRRKRITTMMRIGGWRRADAAGGNKREKWTLHALLATTRSTSVSQNRILSFDFDSFRVPDFPPTPRFSLAGCHHIKFVSVRIILIWLCAQRYCWYIPSQ